jgi:AcrR family transcriptional regulator
MKSSACLDRGEAAESGMRERILGAAFVAFLEKGYVGTSTLEIATRAKISKRDLYANFASKQAILLACIESRATRMRLPPDLPVPRSREALASTLTTFGATIVREVCHSAVMGMFRLAIAEAARSPEVAQALNASRLANRGALVNLFAQAQSIDLIGHCDPWLMMEQFFALLWGDLMVGQLLGVATSPKPAEIEQRASRATAAFLQIYPLPLVSLERSKTHTVTIDPTL